MAHSTSSLRAGIGAKIGTAAPNSLHRMKSIEAGMQTIA
jgi:hypothetical protein